MNLERTSKRMSKTLNCLLKILIRELKNLKMILLRQEKMYVKTLKMKHASNLMKASNKITKIEKKIESYKALRNKYTERNDVLL